MNSSSIRAQHFTYNGVLGHGTGVIRTVGGRWVRLDDEWNLPEKETTAWDSPEEYFEFLTRSGEVHVYDIREGELLKYGQHGYILLLEDWIHFNPRNDMNEEFNKWAAFPQMDVYSCMILQPDSYDTRVKMIVHEVDGSKPIIVVQLEEQYNGQYQNFLLEDIEDEALAGLLKSKLSELSK